MCSPSRPSSSSYQVPRAAGAVTRPGEVDRAAKHQLEFQSTKSKFGSETDVVGENTQVVQVVAKRCKIECGQVAAAHGTVRLVSELQLLVVPRSDAETMETMSASERHRSA